MKRIRGHLSYANVAATLALLFAMSGGAIAATGGFSSGGTLKACVNGEGRLKLLKAGEHCKHGTKTVSWNQVGPAGATGAPGATGAAGPAGLKGADGTKGVQGPEGESGFTNVVVRTATPNGLLLAGTQTVECEPGETAIGGGATRNDLSNNSKLFASAPTNEKGGVAKDGETPTGWVTGVENPGGATTTFYAVCSSS
jgi:hypothetical protein